MPILIPNLNFSELKPKILTLVIAGVGVVVFDHLAIPMPFLFGPLFACLLAALCQIKLGSLKFLSTASRTILGVAIGSTITPDLVAQIASFWYSIALVPIFSLMAGLLGTLFFIQYGKFDKVTAYYSAMPGGFQDMVGFGIEAGGNARILSLVQSTRVFIIVTLVPLVLVHLYGLSFSTPVGEPIAQLSHQNLLLLIFCAVFGWVIAKKIKLFGAPLLGPMLLSGLFSMLGWIDSRPPEEAILAAQFFIGSGIGVFYLGITLVEVRKVIGMSVIYTLMIVLLSFGFTQISQWLSPHSDADVFLAFAPGGQAEVAVFAIVSAMDLVFVITHHVVRIVTVIILAPVVFKLVKYILKKKKAKRTSAS